MACKPLSPDVDKSCYAWLGLMGNPRSTLRRTGELPD